MLESMTEPALNIRQAEETPSRARPVPMHK
jgi:hypothetical protein